MTNNTNYCGDNKAIVAATQGLHTTSLRGPMWAICTEESDKVMHNMCMRSYTAIAAFMIDNANTTAAHVARKGPKVDCLKINCTADREINGAPRFTKVKVPASHQIFEKDGYRSAISERMGMPLVMMPYLGKAQKKFNEVAYMHRNTGSAASSATFDDTGKLFAQRGGNVLIADVRKTPLSSETIETFIDFCQYHLGKYHDENYTLGHPTLLPHIMEVEVSPRGWRRFLKERKGETAEVEETEAEAEDGN